MSQHDAIGLGVTAKVAAIAPSVGAVKFRQDAWRLKGDQLPLVIVTMGDDRDAGYAFGGWVRREYDILLTVLCAGNFVMESGLDDAPDRREVIREALMPDVTAGAPVLAGLPKVTDVRTTTSWRVEDTDQGYKVARMLLTYTANERLKGG